jgi:hypothetical protein
MYLWIKNKKLFFLLLTFYFLLFILITACGRRGDPVAIVPSNDTGIEKKYKNDKPEIRVTKTIPPQSPTGLRAVYTQKSIILTWDEVTGQDVRLYRIYRSTGGDYILVGETVTTAFTDRNVEPKIKYLYRITALGDSESLPSEELEIITEVHQ